jgi:hypothetical protein
VAYRSTHTADGVADTSVSGRAQRSAARLTAVAEALYACELIEIVENPELALELDQQNKEVILNVTIGGGGRKTTNENNNNNNNGVDNDNDAFGEEGTLSFSVLVIYEPFYSGGMGLNHGSILSQAATSTKTNSSKSKNDGGRLIVVLGDFSSSSGNNINNNDNNKIDLSKRIQLLSRKPQMIKLSSGLVTNEVASVQPKLYKTAGEIISLLEPHLRQYNTSAVHFVGHSLAGGVASLAVCILDGVIPMPKVRTKKKARNKRKKKITKTATTNEEEEEENTPIIPDKKNAINSNEDKKNSDEDDDEEEEELVPLEPMNGLGRGRSSALTLGAPPCLSSNVLGAFCTSFVYGDDIVCRTTEDSISRLVSRIERNLHGGFVGRKLGWMSDTLSLTVSSLQSHAHGSEGEEARLSIPGRAYLVRPRKLGGICSIHEVGNLKKGGREALREALLWQMHDVLLSTSMWKHHNLESYIKGLDRTQLRGVADE